MTEVIAVKVGEWKRVKRIELEHNEISDAEFEEARRVARREAVFGTPKLSLDRRATTSPRPSPKQERERKERGV
jgi:hypothetical protein